jgi:hypothetical protein
MRPIAHARRQFSRTTSSHTVDDTVVVANPVPIGIPALLHTTSGSTNSGT